MYLQYRNTKYLGVQAVSAVQNLEILRALVLAVRTPRSKYSRNTASALSTGVVPSESNSRQLLLVGPSVSVLCRTMGLRIVDKVHRRSKYTSFSKYTQHIENISVLRILAVRTLPSDEIHIVYSQYPQHRTLRYLKHNRGYPQEQQ